MDKKSFANTLKSIRQGKNIKQIDITDQMMSRTTYSKIERGFIAPGIANFYNILSRMNVSFEEFFFLYNDYQPSERRKIMNAFRETRGNFDIDQLHHVIDLCNGFLFHKNNSDIRNIQHVCQMQLYIHENNKTFAKQEAWKIWHHLSKKDTWFFDDVLLINNILLMFTGKTLEEMYQRSLHTLHKYNGFQNRSREHLYFSLHFNKLSLDMFYGESSDDHTNTIEHLIHQAHDLRYYDMKAVLLSRKGLLLEDREIINQGMHILQVLELNGLIEDVKEEMHLYGF